MQYLFTEWPKLNQKLKNSFICIFLDYDGTLVPIADMPQHTIIAQKTKDVLEKLAKNTHCQIIIVSGRTLKNIKNLLGIKNVIYAGNHGLEFGDLQTTFEIPLSLRYKILLKKIKKGLTAKLTSIKGALIEDKKKSLCLHYRLVNKKDIPYIKTTFYNMVDALQTQGELMVLSGKKILEITPPIIWHKGKIVLLVLALLRAVFKNKKIIPFFIGDDTTDENAFGPLKNKGITVFVGKPGVTQAKYYLKSPREVTTLLEKINILY